MLRGQQRFNQQTRQGQYVLRMLIERHQGPIVLWSWWFGSIACARHSFGIEFAVRRSRSFSLDRIIQVRWLDTHCCLVNDDDQSQSLRSNAIRNATLSDMSRGSSEVCREARDGGEAQAR